jgi:hypothetical protein
LLIAIVADDSIALARRFASGLAFARAVYDLRKLFAIKVLMRG